MPTWMHTLAHNPEWMAVFASSVFAFVTVCVIVWQVRVMIWLGQHSDRHERTQNRLLKLQFEREWLERTNAQREELLAMLRELHTFTLGLHTGPTIGDPEKWDRIRTGIWELDRRLVKLDIAVYSGPHDADWFFPLKDYTERVFAITLEDKNYRREHMKFPAKETVETLWATNEECKPAAIALSLEKAIRMTFFDFKDQWDHLIEASEPKNASSGIMESFVRTFQKILKLT
jgi:hypothetical protein